MFVVKSGEIIVDRPLDCPFRKDEGCYVSVGQETAIHSCSNDFVCPDDCPLRKAMVAIVRG